MAINLTDALNAATTKGKLADAKQIYLEGDNKNLQDAHKDNEDHLNTLDTRSTQIEESLKTIAATGGASNANAVIYDNTTSGLVSVNVNGAINELATDLVRKLDKASVIQESGDSEELVMSQKAVSDKLSNLPKIITYNYNDFKESNTGIFEVEDSVKYQELPIYSTDYSTTRLINIKGCKKIILTSYIRGNKQFKPFAFYDLTGKVILPEYYFNNFSGKLNNREIIVPSNAEYVEFRSLTSFLDFKAKLIYESDNSINFNLPTKNDEDILLINSLFNNTEVKISEDSHRHPTIAAYSPIPKYIFPKCTLKYIYVALMSNKEDITIDLFNIINGVNDEGFYVTKYDSYTISKEDIIEDAEGLYKIDKEINLPITKNNTLLKIENIGKVGTVQNYDNKIGYTFENINYKGAVVKIVSRDRPICFRATIIIKEGTTVLSNSIKNIDVNIKGINTSFNTLKEQVKKIEESTANVANINDIISSNSETYSSQKIEERIAEIQNASANVQVVNSEGNSTTNAISQAATTLSLGKRVKIFTNVAEMKADRTLKEGMSCQTLGYYNSEDGGHALYVIKSGELTEDKGSIIALNNGLFASLIFDGILNVKQWGWNKDFTTSFQGIIPYDITDTLNRIMNFILNCTPHY